MGPYTPRGPAGLLWRASRSAGFARKPAGRRAAAPPLPTLRRVSNAQTTGPDRAAAWLDEGDVNPEWTPPAGDAVHPSRVRRGLVYGGVLLSLALVIGLLYLTGGFGKRTDLLEPVAPGTLIVTGPYELRFTEATAQPVTNTDGQVQGWKVVAIGEARNTGDETMAPSVFGNDSIFAVRDPASTLTAAADLADVGPATGYSIFDRRHLAPGLPPIEYRVTFRLPPEYRPGGIIRLGVAELEYESPYLTTDEMTWDNGLFGHQLELPLRELPAAV
jgi:hypothetical protein